MICSHPGKKNDHRDHRLVLHNDDISLRFVRQMCLKNDDRIEFFSKYAYNRYDAIVDREIVDTRHQRIKLFTR